MEINNSEIIVKEATTRTAIINGISRFLCSVSTTSDLWVIKFHASDDSLNPFDF